MIKHRFNSEFPEFFMDKLVDPVHEYVKDRGLTFRIIGFVRENNIKPFMNHLAGHTQKIGTDRYVLIAGFHKTLKILLKDVDTKYEIDAESIKLIALRIKDMMTQHELEITQSIIPLPTYCNCAVGCCERKDKLPEEKQCVFEWAKSEEGKRELYSSN